MLVWRRFMYRCKYSQALQTTADLWHQFHVVQAVITFAPFPQSLDSHDHSSSKSQINSCSNLWWMGLFSIHIQYSSVVPFICPRCCWIKNFLHVHFKGFSIIKGSIKSRMKAPLLTETPSTIPLHISELSSDDDICSNHWVMSHLMLSPTSKVPRWDAENSQRSRGRRGETDFLDWMCQGGEENVWHFLLRSLHFWSPPGYE